MALSNMKKIVVLMLIICGSIVACNNSNHTKQELLQDSLEWDTILIDPATYKYRDILDAE